MITIDEARGSLPECLRPTYDILVKPLTTELDVPINEVLRRTVAEGLKCAYLHGQNDANKRIIAKLDSDE